MEFEVQMTAGASIFNAFVQQPDGKFVVSADPSSGSVTVEVDGSSRSGSGCSGLGAGSWVRIGVSIIADDSESFVQIFCDLSLVNSGTITGKKLDFNLNSFKIGDLLDGKLKQFKMYHLAMGRETLETATIRKYILICSSDCMSNGKIL